MLFFVEGGKPDNPEKKTLGARTRTNNKLNPHMTSPLGIECGPRWWEASVITIAAPPNKWNSQKEKQTFPQLLDWRELQREDTPSGSIQSLHLEIKILTVMLGFNQRHKFMSYYKAPTTFLDFHVAFMTSGILDFVRAPL